MEMLSETISHAQIKRVAARRVVAARRTGSNATDCDARRAEHDLHAVPGHREEVAGEGPGVSQAKIDFGRKAATVTFDADKANVSALVKATTGAGYPSTEHK